MEDATLPCEEMFRSVGEGDWGSLCQHAKKIKNEYYEGDVCFDNTVELIIVSSRCVQSDDNESGEDNSADPRNDEK